MWMLIQKRALARELYMCGSNIYMNPPYTIYAIRFIIKTGNNIWIGAAITNRNNIQLTVTEARHCVLINGTEILSD